MIPVRTHTWFTGRDLCTTGAPFVRICTSSPGRYFRAVVNQAAISSKIRSFSSPSVIT